MYSIHTHNQGLPGNKEPEDYYYYSSNNIKNQEALFAIEFF